MYFEAVHLNVNIYVYNKASTNNMLIKLIIQFTVYFVRRFLKVMWDSAPIINKTGNIVSCSYFVAVW